MEADDTASDQAAVTVARLNVALVPEAATALDRMQARTKLKKVDVVNQALRLYEFIDAEIRAGNKILIRDEQGTDYMVKLLF